MSASASASAWAAASATEEPDDTTPFAVRFSAIPSDVVIEGEGEALIQRAERELDRGRAKVAVAYAHRYTQLYPTKAYGWLMLGASFQTLGNMTLAREAYRACVEQGKGRGLDDCRAMGGAAPKR